MSQIPDSVKTQTEYAAHRGVSKMAVSRAVASGRLTQCVARDESGKALGITDFELADREWDAHTDYTDRPDLSPKAAAPTATVGMTLNEANATEKYWKAKQAELNYLQDAAELVPKAEVVGGMRDKFLACRSKLLGIPSRARQSLPHLAVADIVVLENLVREALEEVAT